jgi:hypothetical protein
MGISLLQYFAGRIFPAEALYDTTGGIFKEDPFHGQCAAPILASAARTVISIPAHQCTGANESHLKGNADGGKRQERS